MIESIRLLCVEDDSLVRTYLATRLCVEPGIRLVGMVASVEGALAYLRHAQIDVILLDCNLGDADGMEVLEGVSLGKHQGSGSDDPPAVLFCTGYADATFNAKARALGARGVVHKAHLASDLLPAVQAVANGGWWFGQT